jgi:hypothetical protein
VASPSAMTARRLRASRRRVGEGEGVRAEMVNTRCFSFPPFEQSRNSALGPEMRCFRSPDG